MPDSLTVKETFIPGFYEIYLLIYSDNRAWFKRD